MVWRSRSSAVAGSPPSARSTAASSRSDGRVRARQAPVAGLDAAPAERDQDVARVEQRLGAVTDERCTRSATGLRRDAGQHETSRAYSSCAAAVIARRPACRASTTTTTSASARDDPVARREALRQRLHAVAVLADDQALLAHPLVESRWRRGYVTSSPVATTPTVSPPASSAPSCAAPSIPIANPLTTVTPASARYAAELARVGETVRRRRPRTDDGDPRRVERVGPFAFAEQHQRPVGERVGDGVAVVVRDPDPRVARRAAAFDRARLASSRH